VTHIFRLVWSLPKSLAHLKREISERKLAAGVQTGSQESTGCPASKHLDGGGRQRQENRLAVLPIENWARLDQPMLTMEEDSPQFQVWAARQS